MAENEKGGDGGDISFTPGAGHKEGVAIPGRDGGIRFNLADGTEAMRIDPDGSFYVRGNLVDTDQAVYDGFRAWLEVATAYLERGVADGGDAEIVE